MYHREVRGSAAIYTPLIPICAISQSQLYRSSAIIPPALHQTVQSLVLKTFNTVSERFEAITPLVLYNICDDENPSSLAQKT
jgi:hypothetical protein